MRPPRFLIALGLGIATLASATALAEQPAPAEQVEITIDLDAAPLEIYQSIRTQAWTACKPNLGSHYISARLGARRACQKAMIAEVVAALDTPAVMRLASDDGIRVEG